jgi:hypothetical protein
MTFEREPGCDDDIEDEDEGLMLPLGHVLEVIRLEERVRVAEGERELIEMMQAQCEEKFRAAMSEVVTGRKTHALDNDTEETRALWRLLAWTKTIEAHGGEVREWVPNPGWFAKLERPGEWRSRMARRCPRGCRWCMPKAQQRRAA